MFAPLACAAAIRPYWLDLLGSRLQSYAMDKIQEPSFESIKTSGELAAMGAAIRAILRAQYGHDPERLLQMRDAAKSALSQAAASLNGHPGADVFTDAASRTLDELFGVKP